MPSEEKWPSESEEVEEAPQATPAWENGGGHDENADASWDTSHEPILRQEIVEVCESPPIEIDVPYMEDAQDNSWSEHNVPGLPSFLHHVSC